eukprot:3419644-Alexandrium_andersonii.AAC.1
MTTRTTRQRRDCWMRRSPTKSRRAGASGRLTCCALLRSCSTSCEVRSRIGTVGTWRARRTGTAVRSSAESRFAFCGVPKM